MRLVDTAAAQGLGIKPATLRKWLQRGKLTHHGYDPYGRALVDLDEVDALTAPTSPCKIDRPRVTVTPAEVCPQAA